MAYNSSAVTVHGVTREESLAGLDEPAALQHDDGPPPADTAGPHECVRPVASVTGRTLTITHPGRDMYIGLGAIIVILLVVFLVRALR